MNRPQNQKSDQRMMQHGPMGRRGGPGGHMMTREKPKNARLAVKRLIRYIGKNKYLVFALLVIMLLTTLLSLAGPAIQANAIDAIRIDNAQTVLKEGALPKLRVDFDALYRAVFLLGAIYLASALLSYLQGIFAAKLSQATVFGMRTDLFHKIGYLPIRYTDTHQHGDIMSRMTNDIENVSNTVSQSIGALFSSVITITGSLAIMLYFSPTLTLVGVVTVPLSLLVTLRLSVYMRKFFKEQQVLLGSLNGHVEEMVTGYRTVVAFGREKKAMSSFGEISEGLKKVGIKSAVFGGVMGPLMNLIANFGYLLIAVFGGYLAITGAITVGMIQAFLLYSRQFTRPVGELANQYAAIQTAIAGAERIFEMLDSESESDRGSIELNPEEIKGELSFQHLVFSYVAGEPVLKDFHLDVKPGQKIAIVGATGAGKTTVANLLTRFYDVEGGEILIDGININNIAKKSLRKNIAVVLQDTVLFSDTIEKNIRYGNENASEADVKEAARMANADVFIERLPDGYYTILSEAGGNLSQGQRQLLSIARAALADPKILILDEATSSVDTRTEMHIQHAMLELMRNRTSLIIAHRLSTIKDADRIVVIDDGRVSESGSHEELLEKKGAYYRLYQNQFAGIAT